MADASIFDALKVAVEGGAALTGAWVGWRGVKAKLVELGTKQDAADKTNQAQTHALAAHAAEDQRLIAGVSTEVARQGRQLDRIAVRFGVPITSPGEPAPQSEAVLASKA